MKIQLRSLNIGLLLLAGMTGVAAAENSGAIFTIVPSSSSTNVRSDSYAAVHWTVTNTSSIAISNILVPATTAGISVQNNTCSTLAVGAQCGFDSVIAGASQSSSFLLSPRVCAFNNLNLCSQAIASNRVQVNVLPTSGAPYAYIGSIAASANTVPSLVPLNTQNFSFGNAITNLSLTSPSGIAVSPSGSYVYFVDDDAQIFRVASAGNSPQLLGSLDLSNYSPTLKYMAIHPNGQLAYVEDAGDNNSVYVINIQNPTNPSLVRTISGFDNPTGIAISPDGSTLYVANASPTNTISVVSTSTSTIRATININDSNTAPNTAPISPRAIAVSPDGAYLYVAAGTDVGVGVNSPSHGKVLIYSTSNNALLHTLEVGASPQGIAFAPNGAAAYVANSSGGPILNSPPVGSISIINTSNYSVSTVNTPDYTPYSIAITPNGANAVILTSTNSILNMQLSNNNLTLISLQEDTAPVVNFSRFLG